MSVPPRALSYWAYSFYWRPIIVQVYHASYKNTEEHMVCNLSKILMQDCNSIKINCLYIAMHAACINLYNHNNYYFAYLDLKYIWATAISVSTLASHTLCLSCCYWSELVWYWWLNIGLVCLILRKIMSQLLWY